MGWLVIGHPSRCQRGSRPQVEEVWQKGMAVADDHRRGGSGRRRTIRVIEEDEH